MNTTFRKWRSILCFHAKLRQKLRHTFERVRPFGEFLKRSYDNFRFCVVRFNLPCFRIVHIAKGRERQPFATAEFLANTALHIFNKVVRKILGLSERHLQHEFPLRSWLKPKLREAQRNDFAGIYEIDNASAVHTVASEAIRVPCEYSNALALFYLVYHFGKPFSSGFLFAFRFLKFADDFKIFSTRIFSQFKKLRLNRHYLVVVIFRRFPSVEKIFWFEHNFLNY